MFRICVHGLGLFLLCCATPMAGASCLNSTTGIERQRSDGGARLLATARATSASASPEDVRLARREARLAALAMLERETDAPRRDGRLVGVLPFAQCENGLVVFVTLAADPSLAAAADDLADDMSRSLAAHPTPRAAGPDPRH